MKTIDIWLAHGGNNGAHRLGPVIGYFTDELAASDHAKGRGWYGGDGNVSRGDGITDGTKVWLLSSRTPIPIDRHLSSEYKAKVNALAKLTDNDLKALGLTRRP